MHVISELVSQFGAICVQLISYFGYFGVFILMTMESMIFPVPSELVMPFAGFLIASQKFSFSLVMISSTMGSIFGSLLSYYIGKYGGQAFILKYGKYFLLDKTDLEKTENWFAKKGEKTIFISRFIPVVRHLISLPAGIGKMDLKKFCVYTTTGAAIWNGFLAYCGFYLGKNWNLVRHYTEYFSLTAAGLLFLAAVYFIYRHIKHKKMEKK